MLATIKYRLSEAGQRAAMLATGQPVSREQSLVFDIQVADLELMNITPEGEPILDLTQSHHKWHCELTGEYPPATYGAGPFLWDSLHTPETLLQRIRLGIAEYNRKREAVQEADAARRREAELRDEQDDPLLAQQIDVIPHPDNCYYEVIHRSDGTNVDLRSLRGRPHMPLTQAALERYFVRYEAESRRRKEEKAARDDAKTRLIAQWVAHRGTQSQKDRFAENLLPRSEIVEAIAASAFQSVALPAAYTPALCDRRGCPCGTNSVDALSESTYQAWCSYRHSLPPLGPNTRADWEVPGVTGYQVAFKEIKECQAADDEDADRYSYISERPAPVFAAEVTLFWGPFQFTRLIRLDAPVSQEVTR